MKISTICRSLLWRLKNPAILLFWLLVWQLGSIWVGHELLLVSPVKTLVTLAELVSQLEFWQSIGLSLSRILFGFFLALLIGVVLALIAIRLPLFHDFIFPVLSIINATPIASFIILALVWMNSKNLSAFISFWMVLPVIYNNLRQGLRQMDNKLIEVGKVFGLSKRNLFRYIYLPSVMPYFVSACTVGIGFCWKSGIAAEVIGLPNQTIGMHLYNAKVYLETPELFAWTMTIVLLSVIMEKTFLFLLRRINRKMGLIP